MKKHYIIPQTTFLDVQEKRCLLIGSNDNYAESKFFKFNKKKSNSFDEDAEENGDNSTKDSDDSYSDWN